jgi:hypothetical protein
MLVPAKFENSGLWGTDPIRVGGALKKRLTHRGAIDSPRSDIAVRFSIATLVSLLQSFIIQ